MSSKSKRTRSIPMAEDRISNLPNEILYHILSFLPTKLAASTTILSKRWEPLWLSVLSLDFDDQTFTDYVEDISRFRDYIDSAMRWRHVTAPILSLRLKCRKSDLLCNYINRFIYDVSQRRVENLDLEFSATHTFLRIILPSSVLNCRSLVVLKLKKVTVFDLSQVDFPRLKTLHLDRVCFQHYQDVTKFLYACPILEDLQTKVLRLISRNTIVSMENFQAIPNLIKAKISDQSIPIALVRETKFLQANLTIRGFPLVQFPMFHNLTHMELFFNYTICCSYKRKWNWLIQMLKHCPKLQNLIIHEDFVDKNWILNKSWKDPPVVPECLSSELRTCSLRSCKFMDFDQLQFAKILCRILKY